MMCMLNVRMEQSNRFNMIPLYTHQLNNFVGKQHINFMLPYFINLLFVIICFLKIVSLYGNNFNQGRTDVGGAGGVTPPQRWKIFFFFC